MSLPNLPNKPRVRSANVIEFRGLDRTDGAPVGALSDALNLSTVRYPVLSPRFARAPIADSWVTGADDLYAWDGQLVATKDGRLYVGGTDVCAISSGQHEFAVISGRLVVFPDKLIVEFTGPDTTRVSYMEADAAVGGVTGSVTITPTSISASVFPMVATGQTTYTGSALPSAWIPAVYTYGTDVATVAACCNPDGTWDLTALAELEELSGILNAGNTGELRMLAAGDIIIPAKSGASYVFEGGNIKAGDYPDRSLYNTDGVFGVLTHADPNTYGIEDSEVCWHFDCCKANMNVPILPNLFSVGDAISISGTPAGLSDIEHVLVRGLDGKNNALLFDDNALRVPTAYVTISAPLGTEQQVLRYGGKDYAFTPTEIVESGSTIYIEGALTDAWIFKDGVIIARYTFSNTADTPEENPPAAIQLNAYDVSLSSIHIRRDVPDLDYICESGNRLWGVNTENNTILASALGEPRNFYTFDSADTDSYQVAVGSEGGWTAICAYGGGVCCWKERRLHKILGSYPSEYYMGEYQIEGVGHGCDRSLTIINETLYYSGATGVYAYTGGTPVRVGDAITPSPMYPPYGTVGGTDGRRWFLSGYRWDGESELVVYDTATGLWIKEDDTRAVAMIYHNYRLHVLDDDGNAWRVEPQIWDEDTPWMATFVPFDESRSGGGYPVLRKYYIRLDLRLDMTAGSSITVEVQEDGGAWRTVLSNDAQADVSKRVAILPRRCDRFAVRVSGKGYVVLRAMTREFLTGSERT